MDLKEPRQLKLLISSVVENQDEVEERFERCYRLFQDVISGLSEKEAQNALKAAVASEKMYEDISLGILFLILTSPEDAAKSYRDLTTFTRDGFTLVLNHLSQLLMDRYMRLSDVVRGQILWLVKEFIRNGVTNVDNLCWILVRHAAGGDVSPKNISLIEALLEIFQDNRTWLAGYPLLVAAVVYSFLRLIEDHTSSHLSALRQKEVTFVVGLIREKFFECLAIGRDFVRVIQNVSRIPEIEALWRDMVLNPKSLCPSFTGILQILQTRTSRRYLQTRLTPDMERKLVFFTSHVRFGYQKRYQEWFIRQYLATPEAQTLRCDLIRFIVGVIHPTNELLCSDIIPRWAIIGWLLTTCTSMTAASNAKLALFYDWLFFNPEIDNIMNIEPAVLVMHNSMRSHPAITATLLDFLCRIMHQFYPPLIDRVRTGVFTSLRQILEKRVLPTLCPLFDNPKLDQDLRTMVRDTFKEFCLQPACEGIKMEDFPVTTLKEEPSDTPPDVTENHRIVIGTNNHLDDPVFSDDEEEPPKLRHPDEEDDDDIPLAKVYEYKMERPGFADEQELSLITQLEGEMRKTVEVLQKEQDNEARCQAAERLVQLVIQEEVAEDSFTTIAVCLCSVLQDDLEGKIFPEDTSDEAIEDSIGRPLYVLLRGVAQLPDDDTRRHPLLSLLSEMAGHAPRLGYLLLYYLKACKLSEVKASVYKDYCEALDRTLEESLLADLKLCQEEDVPLLVWLVPEIYAQFPTVAVGHVGLLHIVVGAVDAAQLQDLVCRIVQGQLVMFRRDSFRALLSASLNWETFEQYCLWQLVTAHGIPVDYILPILPRLEFAAHAEALTAILLMLKQERPTAELLRHLLSREVRAPNDVFVVSALKYWCREHEDILGEILSSLLSTRFNNSTTTSTSTSPTKRKRGGGSGAGGGGRANAQAAASAAAAAAGPPSAEQLLGHLDQLRLCDGRLYALDSVQRALQQAQAACSDAQRKRFSDLFALAEADELESPPPQPAPTQGNKGRPAGGGRGRKAAAKSQALKRQAPKEVSETSSESSEEEEVVKPKQPKKRKKVIPVGSDSD